MACYFPLTGYKAKHNNPDTGKRSVVFNRHDGFTDLPVQIPCGRCIGCRLEKSRQWAIRSLHESKMHDENAFLTLTYDQEHIPENEGLDKKHLQDFWKRLRKSIQPKKIRYFACGEYGDQFNRPHYHAILFGHDFNDKVKIERDQGNDLYASPRLDHLWGHGACTIGHVTFDSCAYVARYVLKKVYKSPVSPEEFQNAYQKIDPVTGEIHEIEPEFVTMSRRPGIGATWYQEFKSDCYPSDYIVENGIRMKPPKYYDKLHEEEDLLKARDLKIERLIKLKLEGEKCPERLATIAKCKEIKTNQLKRSL